MITEVSPTATVKLDGSGNGQCAIYPPAGTRWALRLATLNVSSATNQPQGFLYRGSASGPLELVDSTYTGAQASSAKVGGALYYPGQWLWAVWKGGDAGATATLQAYGQQGARSDPLPPSPPGEGFANPVVAGTALIIPAINSPNYVPGSAGWAIKRDGTAEFSSATVRGDVIAGPSTNPIELLHTIPAELVTFYAGRSETVESVQLFVDNTGRYEYLANLLGGFLAIGAVDASHNVQEIAFLGAQSPAAAFGIGEASAVQFYISSQGSASSQFLSDLPLQFSSGGVPEPWHAATYQHGWTSTGSPPGLQYRKVASPPNTLQLLGIMTAGTKTDGTVITNLPAGYRPATTVPLSIDIAPPTLAGATTPQLQLLTTGDLVCFGCGSATTVYLNETAPLDGT